MPLIVRLFASLKAGYGPQVEVETDLPIPAKTLECVLRDRGIWVDGARMAVNRRFVSPEDSIGADDEVAVIPPVSGG